MLSPCGLGATESRSHSGARRQSYRRLWPCRRAIFHDRAPECTHRPLVNANVIVRQCGVSGDTSTGGLARLDWRSAMAQRCYRRAGANGHAARNQSGETEKALTPFLRRCLPSAHPVFAGGHDRPRRAWARNTWQFNAIFRVSQKKVRNFAIFR